MPAQASPPTKTRAAQVLRASVLTLVFLMLALTGLLAWPALQQRFQLARESLPPPLATPLRSSTSPASPTLAPVTATPSPEVVVSAAALPTQTLKTLAGPQPGEALPRNHLAGAIVLAMDEGIDSHLFAFRLDGHPLQRLTSGNWRDTHPAFSPDGNKLAFASNRSGYWDLYLLTLASGEITRLTDTPQYDAAPSWSPDGLWMAYESYVEKPGGGDLEIFIRPVDGSQEPIRLTFEPSADHSPAWSPEGRQIAFVSTRSGESEIWLADLDKTQERFFNVSQDRLGFDSNPAWSTDGRQLAWSSRPENDVQNLLIWDLDHPQTRPRILLSGEYSAWEPGGKLIVASLATPNQTYLTAYSTADQGLALPVLPLPGAVSGITWGVADLSELLSSDLQAAAQVTPTPAWSPVTDPNSLAPGGRYLIVPLQGIQPPTAALQDRVDEAFYALREQVMQAAGWDFLSNLEQTYIPFTSALAPGMLEDWLYTGRAFRFNTAPLNAGWLVVVREDYGPQVYWRVFLRTRFQDGTQGKPLTDLPWSLTARLTGDAVAYERGGALEPVAPPGYWIDFTRLAAGLGWQRQPALSSWIRAYSAARYNEFVLSEGRDWFSAMLEVYPKALLDTPTPVPSPTRTPTVTLTPTPTPTPTRTPYRSPTPTLTPTRRPTSTPRPTNTPWPTITRPPTKTPLVSPTPTFTPTVTPQ